MKDEKQQERRERIAAQILAGMSATNPTQQITDELLVEYAVKRTDALIARLDKEEE